jgi:hypothetical protein
MPAPPNGNPSRLRIQHVPAMHAGAGRVLFIIDRAVAYAENDESDGVGGVGPRFVGAL